MGMEISQLVLKAYQVILDRNSQCDWTSGENKNEISCFNTLNGQ